MTGLLNGGGLFLGGLRKRNDHDSLAIAVFSFEFHKSVNQCEQSVISTHSHIFAGMNGGALLPDDYIAGPHKLSAESFDTKPLPRAVPTVSRTTACFSCGPWVYLLRVPNRHHCVMNIIRLFDRRAYSFDNGLFKARRVNGIDPEQREPLSVALLLLEPFSALLLEHDDLAVLCGPDYGGLDRSRVHRREAQIEIVISFDGQNLVQLDLRAGFAVYFFHFNLVAGLHFVLLTAGYNDGVHVNPPEQ
jgi:hypothetical protein